MEHGIKKKHWSEEENKEVKRLTYQGVARKDIAFAIRATLGQVRNRITKMIEAGEMEGGKRKKWSDYEEKELKRLFEKGEKRSEIALALGITLVRIQNKIVMMRRSGKMMRRSDKMTLGRDCIPKVKVNITAIETAAEEHDKLKKRWLTNGLSG